MKVLIHPNTDEILAYNVPDSILAMWLAKGYRATEVIPCTKCGSPCCRVPGGAEGLIKAEAGHTAVAVTWVLMLFGMLATFLWQVWDKLPVVQP